MRIPSCCAKISDGQYQESAHATRIDDEFTIGGAAKLSFGGSARQTGVVKGHTSITQPDFSSDVNYRVFTSGKAAMTGGADFTFTITESGSSASGGYGSSQSLAASRASQVAGAVTVGEETSPKGIRV